MEDNAIDDEAELDLNKVEEEMAGEDLDEEYGEEESLLDLDALKNQKLESGNKPENIMLSNTTAAEWKLELERVLPQLKVTIRTDNKVCVEFTRLCFLYFLILKLTTHCWQLIMRIKHHSRATKPSISPQMYIYINTFLPNIV